MFTDENTPELEQDETTIENDEETTEETTETTDWQAEYKKAQAQAKKYKAILDRNKGKEEALKEKTDGLGYDAKAYLKASGINATEFDFVQKELKSFGGDIDSLLENPYFQSKLEKQRALAQTAEATPAGKRANSVPTDSVEYWAAKPFEEVPADFRAKVVNYKLDREKNKGIFYNS